MWKQTQDEQSHKSAMWKNINEKISQGRALFEACREEPLNAQQIITMLQESAVNIEDRLGNTPLHILCKNKFLTAEVLKFFVQKGADPNKISRSIAMDYSNILAETPFEILLNTCIEKKDFTLVVALMACMSCDQANAITIILDDIKHQDKLKEIILLSENLPLAKVAVKNSLGIPSYSIDVQNKQVVLHQQNDDNPNESLKLRN